MSPAERGALELKRTRDRFAKAVARLEAEAAQCEAAARAAGAAGRREAALRTLRARKIKVAQAAGLRARMADLEALAAAIASEAQNAAFVAVVREGTAALTALQAALPVETVTRVLEDSADALAAAQELDDAIAASAAELAAAAGGACARERARNAKCCWLCAYFQPCAPHHPLASSSSPTPRAGAGTALPGMSDSELLAELDSIDRAEAPPVPVAPAPLTALAAADFPLPPSHAVEPRAAAAAAAAAPPRQLVPA